MANTVKVQGSKTVARARKGEDGKGIVSQVDYYGLSSASGTRPTSWVAGTPPLMTQTNKYLWKYTRTTYSDGSYTDTTPGIVGVFGDSGLSYRYSKWEEGFEYRNDNNPFYRDSNGKGIVDVVFADDITIWDPATDPNNPPAAWICRQTHTSASARPLPSQGQSNAYWTAMNSTAPILTALVLARKIKADEIDVDTLHVKHLDAADGTFKGTFNVNATYVEEEANYTHGVELEPRLFRIWSDAPQEVGGGYEGVFVWPFADPDRFDRTGLVEIFASSPNTVAVSIDSGVVQGFRQRVQKVTASSSIMFPIVIIMTSSAVTLTLPLQTLEAGLHIKIMNTYGSAFTLKDRNSYSRLRVNGDGGTPSTLVSTKTFSSSVKMVDCITDGTYWYVSAD